jgi:Concanavalin A-like lectin/glucanases superfamily/Cadherin-like
MRCWINGEDGMASNSKKPRAAKTQQRIHLSVEKLEQRNLFSASPLGVPALKSPGQVEPMADGGELASAAELPGLVAAWGFEEASGNTVRDTSGNKLNGTISGAAWTAAGKYGNALSFNGTSALVTVPDANALDLTTGMTLEAWVHPSAVSNTWRDVIYKGLQDIYYLDATSTYGPPAVGGTWISGNPLVGTTTLPVNAWSHLAASYDGAALRLYVNGVQVASRAQTGSIATSNQALSIGGDEFYGAYFAGLIDEVRIYNRALTQNEIQTDMNTAIGPATISHRWAPLVYAGPNHTADSPSNVPLNGEVVANKTNGLAISWSMLSGPGAVTFANSGLPSTTANFSTPGVYELVLTVTNNYGSTNDRVVVTVSSNNQDEVLATNTVLTLAEGTTGTITSARLNTTDADNAAAEILYTITTGPSRGTVRLSGTATTTFTQADINAGRVTYRHNGSETTSDSFMFRVNDLEGPGTTGTFNINVTAVNDEQVLSTNSPLSVAPGATATITSSQLRATDADNTASQLTYAITSGPTRGTLRRSGAATTSFTQADIDAGRITYQHNGSATTSDSFSFTVNDGLGTTTSGTFNISITSAPAGLTDNFDSGDPTGWDDGIWSAGGTAGSFQSGLQTTTEITPPSGGGSSTLRQWWHDSLESFSPQTLSYDFSQPLGEGDVIELEYDIYYDPNFDPGAIEVVKSIILQSTSETDDRIYINTHHFGPLGVQLQGVGIRSDLTWDEMHRYSNINGGQYVLPNGQWVHLRWQFKLSADEGASPSTGYIYGWVNGVKRWEHQNISTYNSGEIESFHLNATINDTVLGPNQKRYWDSFSIRVLPAAGGSSLASAGSMEASGLIAMGFEDGASRNDNSFVLARRTSFENPIPTKLAQTTSSSTNQLLTMTSVENEPQLSLDADLVLENDNDADLAFDSIGETGLYLVESWSDLL